MKLTKKKIEKIKKSGGAYLKLKLKHHDLEE